MLMQSSQLRTFDQLAHKVFRVAFICQLTLVALYWTDALMGSRLETSHSLFDLDSEANIPAWYSSAQLMCATLAFWGRALRQPARTHPSKLFFVLAGCGTLYVSADETAQIHERFTWWMGQRYVDWLPRYAAHKFWMVMLGVAVLVGLAQLLAADLLGMWRCHQRLSLIALLGIGIGLAGGMG